MLQTPIGDDAIRSVVDDDPIIDEVTEYGRIVHAELGALAAAARSGLSVVDGTLYCTTFPCHNCAKHIVASGIVRVVYVEPYPKSRVFRDVQGYGV